MRTRDCVILFCQILQMQDKNMFVFIQADNEMSIEELAAKYANMSDMLMDVDVDVEAEGNYNCIYYYM